MAIPGGITIIRSIIFRGIIYFSLYIFAPLTVILGFHLLNPYVVGVAKVLNNKFSASNEFIIWNYGIGIMNLTYFTIKSKRTKWFIIWFIGLLPLDVVFVLDSFHDTRNAGVGFISFTWDFDLFIGSIIFGFLYNATFLLILTLSLFLREIK